MNRLLALCALLLVLPATASAGQIAKSGSSYVYEADQGGATDVDRLTVRLEGPSIVFEDTNLILTTGFG